MTVKEFKNLGAGDIIRHKTSSGASVVHDNYGRYVIAVRTAHVTNPDEWDLIVKQNKEKLDG